MDELEDEGDDTKVEDKTDDTKVDPAKADDKKASADEKVDTTENKVALKNTVDYLVEQGIWKDFQGREELTEIDSETYAKLAAAQDAERLNERFNELVDSTGSYGKQIIEHIKNGGNPEDIINLFKEQRELESFDTSSDEGKLDYIYTYYSEIIGWKDEKIKNFINNTILKSENKETALAEEFGEVQDKFKEFYSERTEQLKKEQLEINKRNAENQKKFVSGIKEALSKESLPDADKILIEKSITEMKHRLPNGAVVSDFYVKFAEKQRDPAEYVKLVRFVLDREKYDESVAQKADTKKEKLKWDFTKSKDSTKNITSKTPDIDEGNSKLDFSSILNIKR